MPDESTHVVLLVEDDYDIRETLKEVLDAEGYRVLTAEHGAAALKLLAQSDRPCLMLLDLMMPVMDGWTLMKELAADERLASIPVVVVTAANTHAPEGATHFIRKPYDIDMVLEAVRAHCKVHR